MVDRQLIPDDLMEPVAIRKRELLASLPPEWPESDLRTKIRAATLAARQKVVVLDDDPTGTQTVHNVAVLTHWTKEALLSTWDEAETTFYILTNSRRYPPERAAAINQEIAQNLATIASMRGVEPVVISRSDSTLRGHYPCEVLALRQTLEAELGIQYDALVLAPFFLEGGRFTIGDIHWVQEGEWLKPVAQTEFARDPTFGYHYSNLREWVAEKTAGQVPAHAVLSIGLPEIRKGGPRAVADCLAQAKDWTTVIVNAATYRDLEVFVWGMMQAENQSKRFLFRTAASFVRVRGGIADRDLLTYAELFPKGQEDKVGGLTVIGSYVQRSTEQLYRALELPKTVGVELQPAYVLTPHTRSKEINRVLTQLEKALLRGQDVLLYTSREIVISAGVSPLYVGEQISQALAKVLQRLSIRPAYLIGKGGITSSDLATDGLAVRKATVLGQIIPGVPVWKLGAESKYPGLPYVVFPGNVGDANALAKVIRILRGAEN